MAATDAESHSACPRCGYALRGNAGVVCPECGEHITQDAFDRASRRQQQARWFIALVVVAILLYAPHSWLLWIDHPWDEYRWHWLRLSPLLPGVPGALLLRWATGADLPRWIEYGFMAAFVMVSLMLFASLAARSWRWFVGVVILLIPPAIWLGLLTHAIFRF